MDFQESDCQRDKVRFEESRMGPDADDAKIYLAMQQINAKLFDNAHKLLSSLAAKGNDQAAAYLAWLVERGYGCPKDVPKALQLYQAAASNGDPIAQYLLAHLLWRMDEKSQAVRWFQAAADLGDPPALYRLSRAYRLGLGVTKNDSMSRQYLKQAAEKGHMFAARDIKYGELRGEYGYAKVPYALATVLPLIARIVVVLMKNPFNPRIAR